MIWRFKYPCDDYCNGCGAGGVVLQATRDGRTYCHDCATHQHICEVCGSTRGCWTPVDEQLHYEEECFK